MANPYLDAMQSEPALPERAVGAEFDAQTGNRYLDAMHSEASTMRSTTLKSAMQVNGGQFARSRLVEDLTGIPAGIAIRNPEAEKQAKLKEFDIMLRDAPELAKRYLDPDFAKLAHDDAPALTGIEKTFKFASDAGKAVRAALPAINAGLWGVASAGARTFIPGQVGDELGYFFQGMSESQADYARAWGPDYGSMSSTERAVMSGFQSAGQATLLSPLLFAPGGQSLFLGTMGAVTGGQEYVRAREAGLPEWLAVSYGGAQGAVEVATEKLPLGRFLADLQQSAPFWKLLMHNVATEVPGEQVATLVQDMNEWAVLNPQKSFAEFLAERPSAAAQTFIATLTGAGAQVTLMKGLDVATQKLTGDKVKMERALQRDEVAATIRAYVEQSKLAERDPKLMAEIINKSAEGTGMGTVYVDAKQFNDALMQSGVDPKQLLSTIPGLREQLPEALATNGDLELPVGDLLTRTRGTPLADALAPLLRYSSDELTPAEAQAWGQQAQQLFQAEVDNQVAQEQATAQATQEADLVHSAVLDQLNIANRFTPDVNQTYATLARDFYVTMAHRLGITPREMFQRYPLRVVAENVAQDVLTQVEQGQMPAPVANQMVTVGEQEMKASDALAAVDKEDSALQKLLDCLSR